MEFNYNSLIKEIKEKSYAGLISWVPSSYNSTYQAEVGKGIIMVMLDLEQDNNNPFDEPIASLTFHNDRGEAFHSINCYTFVDPLYEDIKDIYEAAHNSYMKIDETLQSMIEDLNTRR